MALNFEDTLKFRVLVDVDLERTRQEKKWGKQRHDLCTWLAILGEEYGEVCQAIQKELHLISNKETDSDNLYEELIHTAAVAVAIAEQIMEAKEREMSSLRSRDNGAKSI